MEIYSLLRALADSWVLLALVLVFLGVIAFVYRPGARRQQRDAAESIFRNETKPAPEEPEKKEVE